MAYRVFQESWETVMNAFMPFTLDDARWDEIARVIEQIEKPYIRNDNPEGVQLEFESRDAFERLVNIEIYAMKQFERLGK